MKHPAVRRNIREVANAKLVRVHEKMVGEFVEQYKAYERSRGECLRLAVEIYRTEVWKKTHIRFADFLMDKLDIQKSQAYRLIQAAEIVESEPNSEIPTERKARAIADAKKNGDSTRQNESTEPELSPRNTTDKNSPSGGIRSSVKPESKPTSPSIKEKPAVVLDCIGTPIPTEALPYWLRRGQVKELMDKISEVKCAIEKAKESEDAMYAGVSNNFIVDMRGAYTQLKDGAFPYAVCTQCQGTPTINETGCSFCKNTGLIPEWRWNTQAMKEVKEMRIKIAADLAAGRLK